MHTLEQSRTLYKLQDKNPRAKFRIFLKLFILSKRKCGRHSIRSRSNRHGLPVLSILMNCHRNVYGRTVFPQRSDPQRARQELFESLQNFETLKDPLKYMENLLSIVLMVHDAANSTLHCALAEQLTLELSFHSQMEISCTNSS